MKKSILVTLTLSAGLIASIGVTSTTASAATWHSGTPSFLVGHKYRSSIHHGYQGIPTYQHLTATKHSIDYVYSQSDGYGGTHTGYQYNGKTYTVRYRAIDWSGNHKYHSYKITRLSSKHIKVNGQKMVKFSKYPTWHGKAVR
ncbi:hypothetical protein ACFP1H_02660 [Secundilactobacillus hailunensis]|uniref:Uncharacterized protein n=1 Tax=Secundilactobacillus hailunensis TaxID=2559923 RepID=A0ABW1T7K7_9LACO|nr:hypothetical protein [Secundilactobacillus hailunensis]